MAQTSETPDQRRARNINELLQELRVAQAGVQILFGFLFSIAFMPAYDAATDFQKAVHLVAILAAVLSVALFTAPVAWHRMLFRQGRRDDIIRAANMMALGGLGCLALAMVATLLLFGSRVLGVVPSAIAAAVVAVMFVVLWFVLPSRTISRANRPEGPAPTSRSRPDQ